MRLPGGARSRRGRRLSMTQRTASGQGGFRHVDNLDRRRRCAHACSAVQDPAGTLARARALLNQEGPLFRSHGG